MNRVDFRPYWSSQHGATITLFICWLIPVFLSGRLTILQSTSLLLLFSGFLFIELISQKLKRGVWRNNTEKKWAIVYGILFVIMNLIQSVFNPMFFKIIAILAVCSTCYLILYLKKLDRLLISQFFTFSIFSLAGFLAFPEDVQPKIEVLTALFITQSIYFGISTITVKYRLGDINEKEIITSIILTSLVIYFFTPNSTFKAIFLTLILVKLTIPIIAKKKFKKIKLKKIGLIESGYSLFFLLIVSLFFPY